MPAIDEFDLLESPLEGVNLIEASAGTGKTYTIAGLYLRLLLEKHLPVDRILVVTFTEAATGELRERIRGRVREALNVLAGQPSEDPLLTALAARQRMPEAASRRLDAALRDFDLASIFTIHGFCLRVLHESAFESGSLFDTELVTEQQSYLREVVEDFWRRHLYGSSALFFNYLASKGLTPDSLLGLLGTRFNQPFLQVIPPAEILDTAAVEQQFQQSFGDLATVWERERDQVEDILLNHPALHRNIYRTKSVPNWLREMDEFFQLGENNPLLFDNFEKFTATKIGASLKGKLAAPNHPFFDQCDRFLHIHEELTDLFSRRLVGLKSALFDYTREQLARRKKVKNVQSFDDLLLNLHNALQGAGGSALAESVRGKFSAALIDEFQDTDPVQYAIFKRIFAREDCTLFLIGDPKQAIYGFRGADIFAYMEAARHAGKHFTLGKNWRSEPELITAVNTIFAHVANPFIYEEIPFSPVAPGKPASDPHGGRLHPPLQVWLVAPQDPNKPDKPLAKAAAEGVIVQAVAAEISRLLSASSTGETNPAGGRLQAGDIAVLVRKNRQAIAIQRALSALGVPAVLYSNANLFDSPEVAEMARLLAAICEPHNEGLLRAAITTDLIGVKGEELDALLTVNEAEWENWLITFKTYHELWASRSFMRMFRRLLLEQNALPRLMSFPDGERRITNILHIAEVLHQISLEKRLSMTGLLKWLSDQQNLDTPRLEEHQLRLESDENAVKLVTIHKSKGLEYPVVFCPFTWDGSRIKNADKPLVFHHGADAAGLTLDLGSAAWEQNKALAEKELLAENVRLLYVALTRAKQHCRLVWGRISEAETSAPAYLLHSPPRPAEGDPIGAAASHFKGLSDEEVRADLQRIAVKANGAIEIAPIPRQPGEMVSQQAPQEIRLEARPFTGKIDRQWGFTSFSSLVWHEAHGAELADRDPAPPLPGEEAEKAAEPDAEPGALNILNFPRGAVAGTLLHEIFEDLDFADRDETAMAKLVAEKLTSYGFDLKWQDGVCQMLQNVLAATLDPQLPELTLNQIGQSARLNELEFYFPIKRIAKEELAEVFAAADGFGPGPLGDFHETIGRLTFSPIQGFMKGFIDLVFQFRDRFYIIDWKSNFLGDRLADYHRGALDAAMRDQMYILQYHIYTVALHQYLRLRQPGYRYESHFGGVFYIFLRGVDPRQGPEYGIYRDRPPIALIENLSAALIGAQHG